MIWCGRWKGRANGVDLSFAPRRVTRRTSEEAKDLFQKHKGTVWMFLEELDFPQTTDDVHRLAANKLCTSWSVYLMNLFQFVIFVCFATQKTRPRCSRKWNRKIAVELLPKYPNFEGGKINWKSMEKICHSNFSEREIESHVRIEDENSTSITDDELFHHSNLRAAHPSPWMGILK